MRRLQGVGPRNLLAVAVLLFGSVSATAQPATGAADYVFTPSTNPPLSVFTYVPRNATAQSRIVFALHGLLRRGADVRDVWDQLNRDAESMKQGAHRLERGKNFFAASQVRSKQLNCAFKWQLHTVPGVGHEFDKMGAAAAALVFAPN